jgi:hypothetical protein
MIRPGVGVLVILKYKNQILFGKRKGSHGHEEWSFPGGHLELNETPEFCGKREVAEETGIDLSNLTPIDKGYTNDLFIVLSKQMETQNITFFVESNHEFIDNMVYVCDSEIISENGNLLIVKKGNLKPIGNNPETIKNSNTIVAILTYIREMERDTFVRGYLYYEKKEYEITNYVRYNHRQIGEWCYDNIGFCYLHENIFL